MGRDRHVRRICAGLLVIFLFATTCVAAPRRARVIRIGYATDYGVITDPSAETEKGYGYEYFAEIAKYTGWTYEYVPCAWSAGMEMLCAGQLDFFGPFEKNAAREARFLYPAHSMGTEYGGLYISPDNDKYSFDDPKSFDGMRVGTEQNNFFNEQFEAYCTKNKIAVTLVNSDFGKFGAGLKNGKFDAVLTGSMMALPDTVLAAKIGVEPFYYVTAHGNEALCAALDAAIGEIELNDLYFQSKLAEKYDRRNPINVPAFTWEEKHYIAEHPEIAVAADPNWAPITYYDPKTGHNGGIGVDVLQALGEVCGISFRFMPVVDYSDCKRLLRDDAITLILPHTEAVETLGVLYTDPFFRVSTTLVSRGQIEPGKPLRVGVSNIQSQPAQALMRAYPWFELVPYANTNALLAGFYAGEISYLYANTYVYDEIVRDRDGGACRALPTDITYPLCVGVSKTADPILLRILNKAIHRLSEGEINSIAFANTVNRAYQIPLERVLRENSSLFIGYLALFLLLLMLVIAGLSRRSKNDLRRIAYVDALTGLPTLAKFQLDAAQILKGTDPSAFLLASVDIDNFKYINDVFGYDMGNEILKCMAAHFGHFPNAYRLVGRSNADNFVFLAEAENRERAIAQLSMLLDVGEDLHAILPANYHFVLSAGVYVLTDPYETFTSCCDKANIARKSIKGSHVSRLREYTDEMDKQMQWKKALTLSTDGALANGDFKVFLQPKYRFSDETLAGAEALVRWQHPEKGMLSPAYFIPHFERNGFIVKLDFYMFRQVCALLRCWLDAGLEMHVISVNLSRLHLTNPRLVEDLLAIADEYDVPPGLVQLELTESIVFEEPQTLIDVLRRMKRAGFEISIDDFGSGYSSLNLLTDLPVDVLKLDKGFLDRMRNTGNSRLIVEQVITLAQKLHLATVAEGVETREQADLLREMGCDLAQGYFYAKPMPAADYTALLAPQKKGG